MIPAQTTSRNDLATPDPCDWLDRHGDYLYRFALAKVRRPDAAEDLVQETLLAAWQGRHPDRPNDRGWLTGILKHKIADWLRHRIRERGLRTSIEPDAWLDGLFDRSGHWKKAPVRRTFDAPDSRLHRAEFWEQIRICIDKLPPRLRDVFVYWQIEDRATTEVCRELEITSANLWVMLHRARLRMWKCLADTWYDAVSPQRERPGQS